MKVVKIKKLTPTAKMPLHGSNVAAGWDLYADIDFTVGINPHETMKINTGLAMEIPNDCWGAIFARSGLATKMGLRPANCVGVIDSDYRGPIIVALHNDSDQPVTIDVGERIAQFVLMPKLDINFQEVKELSNTERGEGGFGSTGAN